MDNVRQLPDLSTLDEEAAAWLARLDADDALEKEEQEALREWLSRSPRHREALNSLNQFWSSNILTELMTPLGRHENQDNWLSIIGNKLFGWPGLASMALASLALVAILTLYSPEYLSSTNGLYVTAVGQQKTLTLNDGSLVHLNTDSQLEVDYREDYRNLRLLQGEAYFDVAKNPDRPFRVYAGVGRVQAVGTAFNVHLDDAGVQLLVTEGRVALASLGKPLTKKEDVGEADIDLYVLSKSLTLGTLDAGELIRLEATTDLYDEQHTLKENIKVIDELEISQHQSWREGFLVFSGESLEQVVTEISRYTTISIDIVDPDLRQLQIGGRFRVGDIESMFAALETNFGVDVKQLNYNKVELNFAQ